MSSACRFFQGCTICQWWGSHHHWPGFILRRWFSCGAIWWTFHPVPTSVVHWLMFLLWKLFWAGRLVGQVLDFLFGDRFKEFNCINKIHVQPFLCDELWSQSSIVDYMHCRVLLRQLWHNWRDNQFYWFLMCMCLGIVLWCSGEGWR